jgi:DNA-binding beta-propeller fold protein YncE
VIKLLRIHSAGPMAVSPDGKTLWVGIGREVIPFSTVTGDHGWATTLPGGTVQKIVITPDNRTVYATAAVSDEVVPIQVSTGLARPPINVGGQPGLIAAAPDGKVVYVGVGGRVAGRVVPISTATSTVLSRTLPPIRFQGFPNAIAFSPGGQTAYITVLPPATVQARATVIRVQVASSTALPPIHLASSFVPAGIAIAPDGKTAYVANAVLGEHTVRSIDLATGAERTITVGYSPAVVAVTPDGKILYVGDTAKGRGTGQNGDLVTPVRTSTGRPGTPIKVGGRPVEIVTSP